MSITKEEVWLRAYCAVLPAVVGKHTAETVGAFAELAADQAVEEFYKKFPQFAFVSQSGGSIQSE